MINAFLRRMYKYHFISACFEIDAVTDDMDEKFLKTLLSTDHCLHPLLHPVKSNPHGLRPGIIIYSCQLATTTLDTTLLSYAVFTDLNSM